MRTYPAPPRWVLDTNVVLSSLVWPAGNGGRLRLAWQAGLFVPVIARTTVVELGRVLAYPKFKLTPNAQEELLADYLPWAEVAVVPHPPPTTPSCRDLDDVKFLQLAIAARVDALVTGDADLLEIGTESPLPILTISEALRVLAR